MLRFNAPKIRISTNSLKMAIFLTATAICCGCIGNTSVTTSKIRLWATNEMAVLDDSLTLSTTDETFEPNFDIEKENKTGTVRLQSCANDQIGFIVVADAFGEKISDLSITCSSPANSETDKSNNLIGTKIYRIAPVGPLTPPAWSVLINSPKFPAWFNSYDALLEIGDKKLPNRFDIPSNGRILFWVDLNISPLATADLYESKIELKYRSSDSIRKKSATIDLKLEVLNILLPDAYSYGSFDHRILLEHALNNYSGLSRKSVPQRAGKGMESLTVIRELMKLSHDHGLNLFDTALAPRGVRPNGHNQATLAWESYDALVSPYLNGSAFADRMGSEMWASPIDAEFPDSKRYGGTNNEKYTQALKSFTDQSVKHFEQSGFANKLYFIYRNDNTDANDFIKWANAVKRSNTDARIISPYPPYESLVTSAEQANFIKEFSYGYALKAEFIEPEKLSSNNLWLAGGLSPFAPPISTGAAAADIRAACWLAQRYCDGKLLLGDVLGWDNTGRHNNPANLFYPAKWWKLNGVVPSVRLKILRRGMKDIAMMRLLAMRQCKDRADTIVSAMTGWKQGEVIGNDYMQAAKPSWPRRGYIWQLADKLLKAEFELSAARGPAKSAARERTELLRKNFLSHTARLRVKAYHASVKLTDKSQDTIDVNLKVKLVNDRRDTAAAMLELPPGPDGFTMSKARNFGEVESDSLKTFSLEFKCPLDSVDIAGHIKIPMWLRTGSFDAGKYSFTASILKAVSTTLKIRIDGNLSEWRNVKSGRAGDFTICGTGGDDFSENAQSKAQAAQKTAVLVCRSDEYLYIAARCQASEANLLSRSDNMLWFDRKWPYGEDFFEIVLNPAMKAKKPSELHRLSVKPNGVVISCKGLPISDNFDNYAGNIWLSDAKVAVSQKTGQWIAEIAIPLKNIPHYSDTDKEIWGVNFIRFSAATNQLSNWASRPYHLYNPDEMGILIWD